MSRPLAALALTAALAASCSSSAPSGGVLAVSVPPELPVTTTTAPATTTTHAPAPRAARSVSRPRPTPSPLVEASGDLIDRLAMCESGQNPRAVSRNNRYFGAWQWSMATWSRFMPGSPLDYSYAEQRAVIVRWFPVSSWPSQFPSCARKLHVY